MNMIIRAQVKLKSKQSCISKIQDLEGNDVYIAHIHSTPIGGKANEELIKLISDYFGCLRKNIEIISGKTSTVKIVKLIEK